MTGRGEGSGLLEHMCGTSRHECGAARPLSALPSHLERNCPMNAFAQSSPSEPVTSHPHAPTGAAVSPSGVQRRALADEYRLDLGGRGRPRSGPHGMAGRVGVLLYGVACYALCLGVFAYAAGWISGIGGLTPTALDAAPGAGTGQWPA